jgi:hypothetical protein
VRFAAGLGLNGGLLLYLTDFLNRTFAGENAKNLQFCGGKYSDASSVYHEAINHGAAVPPVCRPLRHASRVVAAREAVSHSLAIAPKWRS